MVRWLGELTAPSIVATIFFTFAPAMHVFADGAAATNPASPAFADLTIEQLMNEPVTSVAKKETRLSASPAAISVVTQDDIRRFGVTTLPDALRLVPGVDVAQINSHEWAVGVRGFNGEYANKLLVMVDGRSIYGTTFGGVVWGAQDVVMEDLDRIEVIRGPGGTLWGANAVNGVINIITKSAKETQGTMISTTAGTEFQPIESIRYGGTLATNLFYRAYVKYENGDGFVTADGKDAPDYTGQFRGGGRMDWEPSDANQLTLQGDYYYQRLIENQYMPQLSPPYFQDFNEVNDNSGGNVLGRWNREFSETSKLTLQAYFDRLKAEQAEATEVTDTIDLDLQHSFALGDWNDVMWGLGYRHVADKLAGSFFVSVSQPDQDMDLYSAFLQDQISLLPDTLQLTLGSKFEHNNFTGFEFQPSGRLLWTPTERQTVWAAVSRAVRTPSRTDLYEQANLEVLPPFPPNPLPTVVSSLGNPDLRSEELIAYELGYRVEITKKASLDLAAFYNNYNRLILPVITSTNFVPTPLPHMVLDSVEQNLGSGDTYGMEASVHWNVTDYWHWMASYSLLKMHIDTHNPLLDGSPQQQFQVRSELELPDQVEFNSALCYVDSIESPFGLAETRIPSYFRLDLGISWQPAKFLELGLWGQNLLDSRHAEFTSYKTSLVTEVPRSIVGRIVLRF